MKLKKDFDFDLNLNKRFISRCSCIIYDKDKNKVLLFKVDGKNYYMLPGGRIEYGEDSLSAIKREIKEELDFDLIYNFKCIQENFLSKKNKCIMQYCFCYEAIYDGIIKNKFKSLDNAGQTFYWVNINDINKYNIVPKSNINIIESKNLNITHNIEKNED